MICTFAKYLGVAYAGWLTVSVAMADSGIANPASRYCEQSGGTRTILSNDDGGQSGSCILPDGRVCDEWALFRGNCGPGGPISEPFAYCAQAGDTGVIPEFRTGGSFPESLFEPMVKQGLISADLPRDVRKATNWRCMGGQVWVCPVGANIPCGEKADLSREPAEALVNFCESNPGAPVVPAYVTGRATVYSWKCVESLPSIDRQVFSADAAGYLANFWYLLMRPGTPSSNRK